MISQGVLHLPCGSKSHCLHTHFGKYYIPVESEGAWALRGGREIILWKLQSRGLCQSVEQYLQKRGFSFGFRGQSGFWFGLTKQRNKVKT